MHELIPVSNLFSYFNPCSVNEFNGTFLFLWIYSLFGNINKLIISPCLVSRLLANYLLSHQDLMFINQITYSANPHFFSLQIYSIFKVVTALKIMQMRIMTFLSFSAEHFRNQELVHVNNCRKHSSESECKLNREILNPSSLSKR